jgi:hypothetical protein
MKSLGAKLPETKVLEGKLTDMMKLQPSIEKTLIKLNHLTTMPEKEVVDSKKAAAKSAVKEIEKSTASKIKAESKLSKLSSDADDCDTKETSKETAKALKKIEKIAEKSESSKGDKSTVKEMKKALKAITEDSSDALARMSTNVDENSVKNLVSSRICKEGEDEVFDNCVLKEVKREWNDADQGDIKDNNKNAMNKEFGDAAMELIAKVNKKIDDDFDPKKDKPVKKGKKDVDPINNVVEETVKAAEAEVEKAQEKADKVIEKTIEKKEAAANGMIDVFARVLGDNAKVQAKKDDMRSKLETAIMTRAAATDAKIETTRDSLKAGLRDAEEKAIPLSDKTLDAMASLAKREAEEAAQRSLDEQPGLDSMKDQGPPRWGKKDFNPSAPKKGEDGALVQKN